MFDWSGTVPHQVSFPMPQTLDEARVLVHPVNEHKVLAVLRGIAKHDGNFELEYWVRDPKDEEIIWVYSAGTALKKKAGIYTRIIAATKNITQRKQTELREQFLSRLSRKIQQISNPDQIMETVTACLVIT